ncbi:MAG: HD domain-containing phosphohydrolase [bacterium]
MARTVRLKELETGVHVLEAYNRNNDLLIRDFWVNTQSDIERLREMGVRRVTIEEASGADRTKPTHQRAPDPDQLRDELDKAPSKLKKTRSLYEHSVTKIKDVFFSADREEDVDPDKLKPFIEEAVEFARDNPSSLGVLTQLESYDFDTFRHSVNVGLLSVLYAQYRDFSDDDTMQLAFGAMLHDIGKIRIPEEIILKEGDLTEEEFEIVKTHTTRGQKMLDQLAVDKNIQRIALEHHERPDETGYPEGTQQIHPFSRIVSVFDVYDALTSERVYSDSVSPNRAFQVLKEEFGNFPETKSVLYDLLRCLGLYPVGCLVQLTNGEIAVVQNNKPDQLKYPEVCILYDEQGEALDSPYLVDLDRIRNNKVMKKGKFYSHGIEIERVLSIDEMPDVRANR